MLLTTIILTYFFNPVNLFDWREKVQALEGEKGGIMKENGELKQKVGTLETSINTQAKQIQEKDEDIKVEVNQFLPQTQIC